MRLTAFSSEEGVAHVLNSSLNKTQTKTVMDDIRNGRTKLLYVAPESLIKRRVYRLLQRSSYFVLHAIDKRALYF